MAWSAIEAAHHGAGRLLAGVDRRAIGGDGHRLGSGPAGDRAVVAVAIVGRHPVVGARGCRRVAGGGCHAADQALRVRKQRSAGGRAVVVQVERHRPRGAVARHRGLVGNRSSHHRRGRLLAGVDRRAIGGDGHRLGSGPAGDRAVVAVAIVGRHPVVGTRGCRRVAGGGCHAADQALRVRKQRSAGGRAVVVQVERHRPRGAVARHRGLVGNRATHHGGWPAAGWC